MKHTLKITAILLVMFLFTQLFGLFIINSYKPEIKQVTDSEGNLTNITIYSLPYGTSPPQENTPTNNFFSILIAFIISVTLLIFLMKFNAEVFLRLWFFVVVTLALAVTFFAFFKNLPYAPILALLFALPFSFIKVYKRNILVHNLTELAIYPGLASIFVPLFNIWTICILLVLISIYDIYAVWHAGFMQKMARYQINVLKVFSGFLVPYLIKKNSFKKQVSNKKKVKISVAILGGGDVVFPLILAGVVLYTFSLFDSLLVIFGATLALGVLFLASKKGKFYPAMPFITAGCFLGLLIALLI